MPDSYKTFTTKELKDRFEYNSDTGEIRHKGGRFKGRIAGTTIIENGGYRYICLGKDGKAYSMLAHRIAWAIFYGEFAPMDMIIDHVDGNPDNNKIENLRLTTRSKSQKNRGRRKNKPDTRYVNTSVPGITFDKKDMCYVVLGGDEELCRTTDFEQAKYSRWDWEFDKAYPLTKPSI